jgi:stage V sporulation protein R
LGYDTTLTPELQEIADKLGQKSRDFGLDFFTTVFELVDYQQLNEVAAYGGFPTRYPHWRWGMAYDRLSKSYTYGLSIIYEMVINRYHVDPASAVYIDDNARNLVPARELGMAAIHFKNSAQLKLDLKELGVYLL